MISAVQGGVTRSGKAILYPFNLDEEDSILLVPYDALDDNFDAFAIFFYMTKAEEEMVSPTKMLEDFNKRMYFFLKLVKVATSIDNYKQELGIQNDDDLLAFGKKLIFKLQNTS